MKKEIEDFINSFKADKSLKYELACSITASAASVGLDVSDDQQQDLQDKHVDGLVDQVLDDMLHKLEKVPIPEASAPVAVEEEENWNIPNEDGVINVPDYLDGLVNKVGIQMRFHTISGKGELETVCSIVRHAEKYFSNLYQQSQASLPIGFLGYFLSVLEENYKVQKEATEEDIKESWDGYTPRAAVLETYEDMIFLYKKGSWKSQPPLPVDIVEQLEKENPYNDESHKPTRWKGYGWNDCCSKLRELLSHHPATEQKQESAGVWVKELTEIRNKLYTSLPTGEIAVHEVITLIKWHINDIDVLINRINQSQSVNIKDKLKDHALQFSMWFFPAKHKALKEAQNKDDFKSITERTFSDWYDLWPEREQSPASGELKHLSVNRNDTPFPLKDILTILSKATEYLLKNKDYDGSDYDGSDYDGSDYEEMEFCVKGAKEIIQHLEREQSPGSTGEEAIAFAEWLLENHGTFDGFGGWSGKFHTNVYKNPSKQLYQLFKQRK